MLFLEKYNRWHYREKHDAPQFTLKTGTIMEDLPIGLDKWMMAMWQIVNCKNGISSYEVHRAIGSHRSPPGSSITASDSRYIRDRSTR